MKLKDLYEHKPEQIIKAKLIAISYQLNKKTLPVPKWMAFDWIQDYVGEHDYHFRLNVHKNKKSSHNLLYNPPMFSKTYIYFALHPPYHYANVHFVSVLSITSRRPPESIVSHFFTEMLNKIFDKNLTVWPNKIWTNKEIHIHNIQDSDTAFTSHFEIFHILTPQLTVAANNQKGFLPDNFKKLQTIARESYSDLSE
jgi:hypothetical protein